MFKNYEYKVQHRLQVYCGKKMYALWVNNPNIPYLWNMEYILEGTNIPYLWNMVLPITRGNISPLTRVQVLFTRSVYVFV